MSFNLKEYGGLLDGEAGDFSISDGVYDKLNSYVRVKKITGNVIEIDLASMVEGGKCTFRAGTQIMLHASSSNRISADYLGLYTFANITLVNNDTITLDKDVGAVFEDVDLDYESVQAISIPNIDCVHLNAGGILTPPVFNPYTFVGGILVIKCWNTFEFNGGHILLTDCGIPVNRRNALRPLATQETAANGETDQAKFSGQENYLAKERLFLNAGDGAVVIIAKNIICHEDSRIGNINTHGAQFCRGNKTSVGVKPSNVTNIGGSTILLAAETIQNFTPKLIAKYRSADAKEGKGLARCYIASNTKLRNDEGLYAYDTISDPARVQSLGIENFGNGSFGECSNPTISLNNYAKVTSISHGGFRLVITNKTLSGLAPLRAGSLVMVLATQKSTKYTEDAGKFAVGRIVAVKNDSVTLDKAVDNIDLDKYNLQVISMPEFSRFELTQNYTYTPKYENGKGGVFAVAVSGTFDLSGGKINLEGKGGGVGYGRAGLAFIGNAQMSNKLPIGEGHGSAFILAKKLIVNENSRIGATYSGAGTGGRLGGNNATGTNQGGGYAGAPDEDKQGSGGGYIGGGAGNTTNTGGLGGSGAAGGTESGLAEFDSTAESGGYGSNGNSMGNFAGGRQGAHVFIVADSVTGLTVANISIGGEGGNGLVNGIPGAAGYGGGGARGGSSGGSSGFAFIYTNNAL